MIDFYIGPCVPVVRSLLQIERMEFIRLCRRTRHQTIEYRWISFNARTVHIRAGDKLHTNPITSDLFSVLITNNMK